MKNFSSGRVRVPPAERSSTVASSTMRAGGVSPMGEPLAMLPQTVPAVRTCLEPRRRSSSPRSGSMAVSDSAAAS